MHYDRIVIAYHGCAADAAKRLFDGKKFKKSRNKYDWLGTGVYFWEYGPDRALEFARAKRKRKKIETPAIVGALVQLGRCFDLMDTRFTTDLAVAYPLYVEALAARGARLPKNKGDTPDSLLRYRDCAMLNWYFDLCDQEGMGYDTVRGCFTEGGPAFDGSGIQSQSHVQIAVRNPDCILGVFRPSLGTRKTR